MPYTLLTFITVVLFSLVHLWAEKTQKLSWKIQGALLSFGGGIAISYVFVDLLPKLATKELIVKDALSGFFPYFEKHVYVAALLGFLLFFLVDQSRHFIKAKSRYWFSMSSYAMFNFFMGYAVGDPTNPEVQPLALFTLSMSLHYFVNDYTMSREHPTIYDDKARYVLILMLFAGWLVSQFFTLNQAGVALISAFIGGGVIMNVSRHELPETTPHSGSVFIGAAIIYTVLLLQIGK